MSLKINLKADYIAFSKGIKSYRTNISKEGKILLDNYRKEIINDLGPEWED